MIPIGIVTRNRAESLDITLRSLSASQLPENQSLTIFDDASDDPVTLRYYREHGEIESPGQLSRCSDWDELGLTEPTASQPLQGLAGVCQVFQAARSQGVVTHSKQAITELFTANPDAPGVLLLQDDVVFKADWYQTIVEKSQHAAYYSKRRNGLGVLSGLKLNIRLDHKSPPVVATGITAQCLYVSRQFFETTKFFKEQSQHRHRFDDKLRNAAEAGHFWGGVVFPFICQHFGVDSLVRPWRHWNFASPKGRVGFYVHPPYATGKVVRHFQPAVIQCD